MTEVTPVTGIWRWKPKLGLTHICRMGMIAHPTPNLKSFEIPKYFGAEKIDSCPGGRRAR